MTNKNYQSRLFHIKLVDGRDADNAALHEGVLYK